jgi:hypothetical protein
MTKNAKIKVYFETRSYDDTWGRASADFIRGSKAFNAKHRDLIETDGIYNVRVVPVKA